MEKRSVQDIEPFDTGVEELDRRTLRPLTRALGATDLALNHYTLAPGEAFTHRRHTHLDQEEVFYVLAGTATFRTDEGDVEVAADEAIRFAPGEYQRGVNESDEVVRALVVGSPRGTSEVRVREPCAACGESEILALDLRSMTLECPRCGTVVEA